MKMETVIRSPQDGIIKKLAHKEGVSPCCNACTIAAGDMANHRLQDICKAGTVLVLFEEGDGKTE